MTDTSSGVRAVDPSSFDGRVFNAEADRCARVTQIIRRYADNRRVRRILDVGCGAGAQLLDLAVAFPEAELVGVDISGPNIRAAQLAASAHPAAARLGFVLSDFMKFTDTNFDLVVSYSTLHVIPRPMDAVAAHLVGRLAASALVFNAIPYRCSFNALLHATRAVLRVLKSPLTNAAIMGLGRLLHGRVMSRDMLLERALYMYSLPFHYDPAMQRALETAGLRTIGRHLVPHVSIGQFKHQIVAFDRAE